MVVGDALHIPMPLHTPETKTKDPNQVGNIVQFVLRMGYSRN